MKKHFTKLGIALVLLTTAMCLISFASADTSGTDPIPCYPDPSGTN